MTLFFLTHTKIAFAVTLKFHFQWHPLQMQFAFEFWVLHLSFAYLVVIVVPSSLTCRIPDRTRSFLHLLADCLADFTCLLRVWVHDRRCVPGSHGSWAPHHYLLRCVHGQYVCRTLSRQVTLTFDTCNIFLVLRMKFVWLWWLMPTAQVMHKFVCA